MDEDAIALFAPQLEAAAQSIANTFEGDVFLVGSALSTSTPKDIDLRVVVSRRRFEQRYGTASVGKWIAQGKTGRWGPARWLWSSECVDVSRWVTDRTGLTGIDFQVYPVDYLEGASHLLASFDEHAQARLPEPDVDELNAMRVGETEMTK